MRKYFTITCGMFIACFSASRLSAQLVINGGSLTLGDNSFIAVQGDLTSNADITGNGKIILNGSSAQSMNLNGYSISNLEINSTGGVTLTGDAKIGSSLTFTGGKIQAGSYNLTLSSLASFTGAGAGKFIETNGTGQVRKEVTTAGNYDLPVGAGSNYMPLQYQLTGGSYAAGSYIGTRLVSGTHPNKPIRATDYISGYWKPAISGVSGATINAVATYNDAGGVTGDETLLNALRYDGSNWSLNTGAVNTTNNTVTYNSVATGTDLYAMDKFLLASAKVFLQGAYNAGTGKMNDNLRTPTNLIPLSDPYRTAPYSTFFTHANNTSIEIANASVFATQALDDDNIVDWVFVELRNTSGTLIQTRSALLQKDGDIVDIDGVNPLFFKNLDAANYVVTVRHRNHLGISADLTNYSKALSVANPTLANRFDFTTADDTQIFGDVSAFTTNGAVKMMWAGNASSNNNTRYTGPSNDHSYLLSTVLGGNSSTVLSAVYSPADLNMNGNVRYTGPSNDHSFLLTSTLAGNSSTVITQQTITP